jgi:hypothetical protein
VRSKTAIKKGKKYYKKEKKKRIENSKKIKKRKRPYDQAYSYPGVARGRVSLVVDHHRQAPPAPQLGYYWS